MANFQVNLLFKADTAAATSNIQQLGSLLTDISTKTKIGVDSGSLSQAVTSAQQLSIHLQNAMNQNTGKLDLSKLSASLKSAGTDLQTLTTQLRGAGPAGEQAFIKVATAIASAEAPMIRINQRLKNFGITLANTVKWQIASTAIHGVSSMLASAVGHAEDLNKALNDIRIVTGYSVDTMSKFAAEASVAAKELSTTTTEYAKAALIFYQQGLNGDAVTERADVVIKLSQVTRQSAEQVSSQMTAIWNNFDDGTKSLEYYADALTKLGAATAASTDEISDGLEKFAAIAETVGLSYEYAAAAVATVIDKTRQSADVVGTAFKTIFARMQGLSLGDTLEDGVDLNKYSAALEKVGVDVLTAEGELRDMDDILSDLGEKWQGFGKETKVALAQTVAGVRQYNQMMSLMDNWDSVKENIDLAKDATGELTKQQEIWSESYEAASNRVKQAQNELYEKFINDKSIVKLNDIFAELIGTVSRVIDSMGGILPMVLTIAAVFSRQLFPLLQTGFQQLINNFNVLTGKATKDLVFMQNSMRLQMQDAMSSAGISDSMKVQIALSENLLVAKQKLTLASKNMSAAEQEEAQRRVQLYEALVSETQQSLARQDALEREIALQRENLVSGANRKNLAESAGRSDFYKFHSSLDESEVDEIFEDATTFTSKEIQQQQNRSQQRFDQRRANLNVEYEEFMTAPANDRFTEEDRAEGLARIKEEMKALAQEEEAQIQRYKLIAEMQSRINGQKFKKGEDISVGTVESYTDPMQTEYGAAMTAKAVTDIGGVADDGLLEVDASVGNLESLYAKMSEYNNYATQMDTLTKEIDASFKSTDGTLMANVGALQSSAAAMAEYQAATEQVDAAQEEYDAAVRKATEAQQAAAAAGKNDKKAKEDLKKANDDLQKKELALAKARSQQKAALDKGTSSGQNYVKQLTSMKNTLIQTAQAAGNSQDDIAKINQAFEDLGSGDAQKAARGLQDIQDLMKKFKSSSDEAVMGLDNIAAAIKEKLIGSGMNPAQLDAFISNLVEMGVISPDIANKLRIVGEAGGQLGTKVKTGADLAMAGISAMATAAGQLSMAVSGFSMFFGAFEEGLTPLQRFTQIIGSLPMILGAVGAAIKLVSGLKQRHTLITSGETAATLAQMAAENKLILSEGALAAVTWVTTAAQWAWNAAKTFALALTGQYGAIALAAAAAVAVMGVAVAVGAAKQKKANQELSEAQREQNEATIEQTEKTNELSNAWADQMSVMDNLIAKYEALRNASGDYGESIEDIIDAVPDVIDAYTQLAEGLDLNPEQLAEFNELIKEMRQGAAQGGEEGVAAIQEAQSEMDALLSPEASKAAKEGAYSAMSQTAQAIVDVGDASWENDKVTRHVGGAHHTAMKDENGMFLKDENGGYIYEEDMATDILQKHGIGSNRTSDAFGSGIDVSLRTDSSSNFLDDYESLLAAQKEMEQVLGDAVDQSDTYREISDMLKGSEEEYTKLAELQAEAEKFGVIDAKVALEEQGQTIEGIDSYGAYNEYKAALVKQMTGENATPEEIAAAEAAADAWLRAQGALEGYVKVEDKIGFATSKAADEAERLATAAGLSEEEVKKAGEDAATAKKEQLDALYNSLDTDEERALFLEVDFNKYESDNAIKAEIARLQGVAESEEIQVKIDKIATAQSTLKEDGMTAENWDTMRNETLNWGQDGIMEFNDFLNMSYEAQQQYLNDQMNAQQEALVQSKQATIDALNESLNNVTSDEEKIAIQENIDLLEDELAVAERLAEEQAIEAEGIDYQEWQDYAKYLREVNGLTKDQIELSEEAALKEKKQIKAIKDLESNFSKYAKTIKAGNVQSEEYAEAIENIKDNIELLTDTDISNFTDDFITNPRTIQALDDIANGVDGAIEKFQSMAAVNAMVKLGFEMDDEGLIELENKLTEIQQQDYNVPIGATLDDSAAIQGLASLLMESGATADQIQAAFNQIGWEPEIETRDYTVTEEDVSRGYISVPVGVDPLEITQVPLDSSVSSGMTVQLPYIKSATKTGVSGGGYKPQSNKSGGGGGGGAKHAEKKSSSERTRYHTLENQLEDLTDAYSKVSEAADRAFGKDRIKLIDEEIAATDDLIDKQEEYIDAISTNLPIDKALMTGYYDEIIGGTEMQFDENGNISNYDDIEAAMHAKYNEMADKYTSDSEEWQQFEKQYEKVEQYIEQYEETYDLLRDEEGKYQDLLNQRMDLELTKIEYKAELSLNIEDDEIAVIEHQLDMIGDNAFKAAEAIELQIEKAESVYDKIQVNQSALNDILGQQLSQKEIELFYSGDTSVLEGKSFTDNQIQAIKGYRDSLLDLNSEMMDIRNNIQDQVMTTFDAWNEKLSQGAATLDHYGSVLDSYKNIVDVVGKDVLGLSDAFMSDLGAAQVSNAMDQVAAAKDAYDSMMSAQADAQRALDTARANGDEESIKYWEDTLQSITENAQSAQQELLGSWEEALNAIATQFENAVQMIVDTFNDSVYALGGLEGLSEDFSRQLENSDVMLDDYHKIYELSKLTRDINNKLDDTKIIAGKQKLKDLLEEINEYQQDGVEMSQYDLEYLQAEYDLRLAEIELEEAQRAKNTVRMSRDNEGNWSYVYTQNTDAVDSAQQKYEDALYAMQDLSSNYIDEMSEQLISTSQEMQEALAAIRIQDYASIDEYYAEVERVQKQYQDELAMQEEELNKAIANNKTLYDEDWTNYHNATGYKISDTKDFATTFKDTLLGTIMGSEEDTSNFTSIIGSAVQTMSDGLMQAAQTYYTNLETAMQAAGTSTGDFAEDTAANIDAVVAKSQEGAAAVDQMAKEMDEAFSSITDKVSAWQETYGLAMQSIIDSNLAVVESFNSMLEAMSIDAGQITVNYDINTTPDGVDPAAFDTGGYTGEWGADGKLAVLHEKEMILNQGDTEKFLKAMAYSKMILETIELNAKQASLGMGQITPTVVQEEAPQTLEQMVHITAEFPGVNDHYEIEEAFNNLINKASQYANRKM